MLPMSDVSFSCWSVYQLYPYEYLLLSLAVELLSCCKVRTSCHETSAQYFLLTPKLLPGLDYSPRMNILIVNNGPGMCHHSNWKMEEFHKN